MTLVHRGKAHGHPAFVAGALLLAITLATGCRSLPIRFGSSSEKADSLYWRAVSHLDAANRAGSTDSAMVFLDAYLSNGTEQKHRQEALVLRQLTRDSRQLARVEAALQLQQQLRSDSTAARPAADAQPRRRDDEALVKEIQRLKEELSKANEELDRIKKRLAVPKPPAHH